MEQSDYNNDDLENVNATFYSESLRFICGVRFSWGIFYEDELKSTYLILDWSVVDETPTISRQT